MSVAILRFSALCCVVTLVAGCGGSSIGGGSAAGGGSTPTVVTFNFTIATPTVVAARVGAGLFTTQTLNSRSLSLSIPNGTTNFSVAYACTLPLSAQVQVPEQFVFEASTADGSSFTAPCPMAVPSAKQERSPAAWMPAESLGQHWSILPLRMARAQRWEEWLSMPRSASPNRQASIE